IVTNWKVQNSITRGAKRRKKELHMKKEVNLKILGFSRELKVSSLGLSNINL
ncbi:45691_t:CDS:1, partial [Gigaspora margarita]